MTPTGCQFRFRTRVGRVSRPAVICDPLSVRRQQQRFCCGRSGRMQSRQSSVDSERALIETGPPPLSTSSSAVTSREYQQQSRRQFERSKLLTRSYELSGYLTMLCWGLWFRISIGKLTKGTARHRTMPPRGKRHSNERSPLREPCLICESPTNHAARSW